jgi:Tol biopolymer transport system component
MKKLIMGSAILSFFAIAIVLFQISCQKTATAQTTTGTINQLNKVLVTKFTFPIAPEIWTVNYDGTGATKVNIVLPAGIVFSDNLNPLMSPNGQKIFFEAGLPYQAGAVTAIKNDLYSCNADGSSVTKIMDKGTGTVTLNGAY